MWDAARTIRRLRDDVGRTVTVLTRTVKYVKSLTWDVFGTATVCAPRD